MSARGRRSATRTMATGTITDSNTELVWEKLSDDGSVHDVSNHYTWDQAFAHVAALNGMSFAGHADWRLPNVKELASIVNYQNHDPAVSAAFNDNCTIGCTVQTCSCTGSVDYWSSTTNMSAPPFAWLVSFKTGFADAATKGGSLSVRAVRGGPLACRRRGRPGAGTAAAK
jgi:hypothetical protein